MRSLQLTPSTPSTARWRACRWPVWLTLSAPLLSAAADAPAGGWQWAGLYKADLLRLSAPGLSTAVGNLGLSADADAAALFGWDDTTLHAELLLNQGGKPNRHLGSTQGISNLEVVQNAGRLYATWIEHDFKAAGGSLLFGLYDLNSEFYATDAAGLLVNPSFGIGIDFSQSGRNGPSIFPNLGLAARWRQGLAAGHYLQAAVIDGVPGDPAHPGRTTVHLSRDDGALLVGEWGWQQRDGGGPGPGHWGVGAWRYTQSSVRLDAGAPQPNQGAYFIAQGRLAGSGGAETIGFLRAGLAQPRVNAVDVALDTGLLLKNPFAWPHLEAVTAGLAVARYSAAQRAAAPTALGRTEAALEIGARWRWETLALQPWLQGVRHPGGRPDGDATVAGLRVEWAWGPPQR